MLAGKTGPKFRKTCKASSGYPSSPNDLGEKAMGKTSIMKTVRNGDATHSKAHVHRFGDSVALHIADADKGLTVYYTPAQAIELATLLSAYAFDCDTRGFTDDTKNMAGHGFNLGDN